MTITPDPATTIAWHPSGSNVEIQIKLDGYYFSAEPTESQLSVKTPTGNTVSFELFESEASKSFSYCSFEVPISQLTEYGKYTFTWHSAGMTAIDKADTNTTVSFSDLTFEYNIPDPSGIQRYEIPVSITPDPASTTEWEVYQDPRSLVEYVNFTIIPDGYVFSDRPADAHLEIETPSGQKIDNKISTYYSSNSKCLFKVKAAGLKEYGIYKAVWKLEGYAATKTDDPSVIVPLSNLTFEYNIPDPDCIVPPMTINPDPESTTEWTFTDNQAKISLILDGFKFKAEPAGDTGLTITDPRGTTTTFSHSSFVAGRNQIIFLIPQEYLSFNGKYSFRWTPGDAQATATDGSAREVTFQPLTFEYDILSGGVPVGVESILETQPADARLYTIDGRRAASSPAPCVYILKENGKTTKIVIR